jgi:hypothetical protein
VRREISLHQTKKDDGLYFDYDEPFNSEANKVILANIMALIRETDRNRPQSESMLNDDFFFTFIILPSVFRWFQGSSDPWKGEDIRDSIYAHFITKKSEANRAAEKKSNAQETYETRKANS